jgi:hypothetical protein
MRTSFFMWSPPKDWNHVRREISTPQTVTEIHPSLYFCGSAAGEFIAILEKGQFAPLHWPFADIDQSPSLGLRAGDSPDKTPEVRAQGERQNLNVRT